MRLPLILLAAVAGPSTSLLPAPALALPGRAGGGDRSEWFGKADADHDGQVTRAEFDAFRQARFEQLDRNGDGAVSPADFPRLARARPDAYAQMTAMLGKADANGDGAVSRAEMGAAPPALFTLADANGDGRVTKAEYDAARERTSAAMAARRK